MNPHDRDPRIRSGDLGPRGLGCPSSAKGRLGSCEQAGCAAARWGLVRDPAGRLEPQAFLCTDLPASPSDLLLWFRQRWQVEVPFEEVRAHLGVETQRQWSEWASAPTPPAGLGWCAWVTLVAPYLQAQPPFPLPQTAWSTKSLPTFVETLARVRRALWAARLFELSVEPPPAQKIPLELLDFWSDLLCYAA